jgi:hypothetical protein
MTFDEFCDKHRVTIHTIGRSLTKDDRGWEHYAMTCLLKYERRSLKTPFMQGTAHADEPTAAEVLACLISDAQSVESARSFEDWCGDLGYDSDSRKAEATYKACEATGGKLRRFLGEDYDAFVIAAEGY